MGQNVKLKNFWSSVSASFMLPFSFHRLSFVFFCKTFGNQKPVSCPATANVFFSFNLFSNSFPNLIFETLFSTSFFEPFFFELFFNLFLLNLFFQPLFFNLFFQPLFFNLFFSTSFFQPLFSRLLFSTSFVNLYSWKNFHQIVRIVQLDCGKFEEKNWWKFFFKGWKKRLKKRGWK